MLQVKLSPCASLLYQWVLSRETVDNKLKIDLQDFQAWTGEFREKAYSYAEVFEALCQLRNLDLVNVSRTEVTLEATVSDRVCLSTQTELVSTTEPEEKQHSRSSVLVKIALISIVMTGAVTAIGIGLMRWQPETLNINHPWSALSGDRQQE